jgi:hypothetical protein
MTWPVILFNLMTSLILKRSLRVMYIPAIKLVIRPCIARPIARPKEPKIVNMVVCWIPRFIVAKTIPIKMVV